MSRRKGAWLVAVLTMVVVSVGCASTGGTSDEGARSDLLTREQILSVDATNLYDVIRRLRPRWLTVRSTRSLNMETSIVVLQNDMYLGTAQSLREMSPELAYEIQYMDGMRASATLPGITSGQHVEAAIIVRTRPRN
jgi:hypothetical protein